MSSSRHSQDAEVTARTSAYAQRSLHAIPSGTPSDRHSWLTEMMTNSTICDGRHKSLASRGDMSRYRLLGSICPQCQRSSCICQMTSVTEAAGSDLRYAGISLRGHHSCSSLSVGLIPVARAVLSEELERQTRTEPNLLRRQVKEGGDAISCF